MRSSAHPRLFLSQDHRVRISKVQLIMMTIGSGFIMKKILSVYVMLAAICLTSCSKNEIADDASPSTKASFRAYYLELPGTKTTYLEERNFNWVGNEIVSMDLIKNSDDSGDRYDFYIPGANIDPSDKTVATFESAGSLSLGPKGSGATFRLGARAYYPGQKGQAGYPVFQIGSAIKTSIGATTVAFSETFKPSYNQPMRVIPMIGNNDGDDNFAFHTATGILKVTLTGVDFRVKQVQLYSEGQQLSGTFEISSVEEGGNDIECYKIGNSSTSTLTIQYVGLSSETTRSYYFPVPVGMLNANFEIRVIDIDGNTIKTASYPSAVPIERNHISVLTKPISLSLAAVPDASALGGLYYGNASHNITLSASDDAVKGNIMISAGTVTDGTAKSVSGKIYGYYDGSRLYFDGSQAFNEYSGTYYCVHGQGRSGTVKDVLFNVDTNGSGKYTLTATKRTGETATDFGIGKVSQWTCDQTVKSYSTTSTVWGLVTLTQQ